VCAVKINLHELLLDNRADAVNEGAVSMAERTAWKLWKQAMLHRSIMNLAPGNIKSWVINRFVTGWKANRSNLDFPQKSFNQLWREGANT
jgi:L-lactate dehydrogenase complex protein LldF